MSTDTPPRLIVATDLDGTLLDHHDYSWEAARPAMHKLDDLGIPVILNTSKTYAEVIALQNELGLHGPFIVENGSALYLPANDFDWLRTEAPEHSICRTNDHWEVVFGVQRRDIIGFVHELRRTSHWQFEGFSDWSVEQIMASTGLDETSAGRAAEKMFSEPISWNDSDAHFDDFARLVTQQGLTILKGGRFFHVQGKTDKGRPLLWLQDIYEKMTGIRPGLVCLGDSNNDSEMLNVADYPVCVRSPVAGYPELDTDRPVILTEAYGPAGWNEAINKLLSSINNDDQAATPRD